MKNILITGSSRGIGLDIALGLLNEGNNIVINGRNKKKLEKLKKKNKLLNYVVGDFSLEKQSKIAVKKAIKILGKIDILICNIGQSKSCLPNNENLSEWKKIFNQNFFTTTNAIENCKNQLIKNQGKIICISSAAGNKFIEGAPITYSTAKSALNFYGKSLSFYLGKRGVTLNIIAPGNTLFKGSTWEKKIKADPIIVKKLIKKTVPLNNFATPQDISNLVKFLISDQARFINGAVFTIDGGQTI